MSEAGLDSNSGSGIINEEDRDKPQVHQQPTKSTANSPPKTSREWDEVQIRNRRIFVSSFLAASKVSALIFDKVNEVFQDWQLASTQGFSCWHPASWDPGGIGQPKQPTV